MASPDPDRTPVASQRGPETKGTAGQRGGSGTLFPLGYKEGLSQWWSAITPAAAEAAVLSLLPFNHPAPALSVGQTDTESITSPPETDPYGPRQCTSDMVQLSGNGRVMNEFSITRTGEPEVKNHLVMVHGYGAGLAFFYRNFDALSRRPGWKVWALDLLGYGRSSRPPFTIHAKDPEGKISEAENWFIDALEEWRKERGIEKFTLLGHSLGGYLSFRYALKYPDRVNKLIMASPVGVPEDPFAVRQELPDESTTNDDKDKDRKLNMSRGLMSSPDLSSPGVSRENSNLESAIASNSLPDERDAASYQKPNLNSEVKSPRRSYPKWLVCLWEANVSPFSLVRWAGPFGPRLVSSWTSRRFGQLPEDESRALHNYAYSLFRQRGSGEYALAYILAPGAFARRPLIWRVQDLVTKTGLGGIPSVWMYGDIDWMDITGGFAAEEKIRSTPVPCKDGKPISNCYVGGAEWRGEKPGYGGEAKVLTVQNAGHHLYLDGAEEFNGMIIEEMKDVEVREEMAKRDKRSEVN